MPFHISVELIKSVISDDNTLLVFVAGQLMHGLDGPNFRSNFANMLRLHQQNIDALGLKLIVYRITVTDKKRDALVFFLNLLIARCKK